MAATAVEEVTGRPPRSVEQFAGGWGAVPFWATAADGTRLVVRVGHEERPYTQEAATLACVRAAGIPAPEVAGVCRVEGRPVSVLVRVDGAPLSDVGQGPDREERCFEAGRWLARVHDVDAGGLDLVPAPSLDRTLATADALVRTLPATDARVIADAVAQLDVLRAPVVPALCHADFGSDHVLTDGDQVTAIIDWEWASFGDPARDLGWWLVHFEDPRRGAPAVREGYGPPDAALDARVRAWMFAICIEAVQFRLGQGDPTGTAATLRRIAHLFDERTFG